MRHTVEIRPQLFIRLLHASEALGDLHDAFEDYLISTNPRLLRKLRRACQEDLAGKARLFQDLKRDRSTVTRDN